MKRIIIALAVILTPFLCAGQAQINTKKVKISDFTQKVTKIVLTGNEFYDSALKDEVAARWRISPYEFCTLTEFLNLKTDSNYYFLITTKGQFKKENAPGLQFLSLVKGGEEAENGIDAMLEIVSFPFASAESPSGRELVFLPAFLDIIQNYTTDSMAKDINAYTGLGSYSRNITKSGKMTIIFAEEDLSPQITDDVRKLYFTPDILILDENSADSCLTSNAEKTLVSYVAAPVAAEQGSYCYTMLIDAQTHKLYYYRRHRISKKAGAGFVPEDIRRITAHKTTKR